MGYRKISNRRSGAPMMLLMLAKGASIISIIRSSFLQQGVTDCISSRFRGGGVVLGPEPWVWARCDNFWL